MNKNLSELQNLIGYHFKDIGLLHQALTHTSYANETFSKRESHLSSNQRLEFLGDSVLSVVVSTFLYEHFTKMPEGELSKVRSAIVCEGSLAKFAEKIRLMDFLFLGVGEERSGGRDKPSIVADAYESLIAAIYLDGGITAAGSFILTNIEEDIYTIADTYKTYDYKTNLQELMGKSGIVPQYEIVGAEGPEHNRYFIAELKCGERQTFGRGRSKKEAEQAAAAEMMHQAEKEK